MQRSIGTPAPLLLHWKRGGQREAGFALAAALKSAAVAGLDFASEGAVPASGAAAATPASGTRAVFAGGGAFAGLMSSGEQGRAQNPWGSSFPRASDSLTQTWPRPLQSARFLQDLPSPTVRGSCFLGGALDFVLASAPSDARSTASASHVRKVAASDAHRHDDCRVARGDAR
jgi:hypothetical protein